MTDSSVCADLETNDMSDDNDNTYGICTELRYDVLPDRPHHQIVGYLLCLHPKSELSGVYDILFLGNSGGLEFNAYSFLP